MTLVHLHACAIAAALAAVALAPRAANALPAFGRKTGLSCSACHEVWPRLNDFGQLYRDNGYRLKRDRDAPVDQDPSYWPIAVRTTPGYQWLRNTLVPTDTGKVTTQTGSFGFTGLDIFAAGTLGEKLSFLITYTPALKQAGFGLSPSDGNLESVWIGFNDIFNSSWLNVRVGKHGLDLPVDEHRTLTLTQGYGIYHFHPQGSSVTWEPGNNQVGVELYGHSALSRARYSVSFVNENQAPFSNNVFSSPAVWGRLSGTQYLETDFIAAVRGGVFGSVGFHPTSSRFYTAQPGAPVPVVGTDRALKPYQRYGAEAHVQFFSLVTPLTLSGVVWQGTEDRALIASGVRDARFQGGFVELTWTPDIRFSVVGRYERIVNRQAGSDQARSNVGDTTIATGAIRHTFELTSRTEAALHLEFSRFASTAPDGVPDKLAALVAFDIAL